MMRFAKKVAVITGASSGIGAALARTLSQEGAAVGLIARRQSLLEQLSQEIRRRGGTVAFQAGDVADRAFIRHAMAELRGTLGPIDLLVANAGVSEFTNLDQSNIDDVEKMIRINLLGVVYAIEAVLPDMLARDSGHIAGISSLAAFKGLPGHSGYCATKAAICRYLEGLRIDLHATNVHVSTIYPGFVRTPMTDENEFDMPWLLEMDDAAQRIAKALHRRVRTYSFPWQLSWLMQLSRIAPDWLVHRVIKGRMKKARTQQVSMETTTAVLPEPEGASRTS